MTDDEGVGAIIFNIEVVEAINDLCWIVSFATEVSWDLTIGMMVDVVDTASTGVCWMCLEGNLSEGETSILDEDVILIWTLSTIDDVCTICGKDFSTTSDEDFSTRTTFKDEEGVIGWTTFDDGVGGGGGGMSEKYNENKTLL